MQPAISRHEFGRRSKRITDLMITNAVRSITLEKLGLFGGKVHVLRARTDRNAQAEEAETPMLRAQLREYIAVLSPIGSAVLVRGRLRTYRGRKVLDTSEALRKVGETTIDGVTLTVFRAERSRRRNSTARARALDLSEVATISVAGESPEQEIYRVEVR